MQKTLFGLKQVTSDPDPPLYLWKLMSQGEDTTEWELMLAGKPYLAGDPFRCRMGDEGAARCAAVNAERDPSKRQTLLKKTLTSETDAKFGIAMPIFFEYGFNIVIGDDVYIGPNCYFLDVAKVTIGSRTLIGPNVQFYPPQHPVSPEERNGCQGREWASPITIGTDCWFGGAAIVLGGVTIGNGCTIGAGCVVTKNVPDRSVVVGNPGRVIKTIPVPEEAT